MRCLYVDLDGTLLGPGGSLLRGADGRFALEGVRALQACCASRRRGRALLGAPAVERVRGQPAHRLELVHLRARLRPGARRRARVADRRHRALARARDDLRADRAIRRACAAARTLRRAGSSTTRPGRSGARSRTCSAATSIWPRCREVLDDAGFGWLRLVDNGVVAPPAEQMAGLPVIHAYHLIPAGASKARAVARHMQARAYSRGRLHRGRRLARGYGRRRRSSARSGWWRTRSSATRRWRPTSPAAPGCGSHQSPTARACMRRS